MKKPDRLSPAKEIAYIAVTTALLIGVQFALYAAPGVECVTVLLLCTSYVFGARFGALTGLAFSLLRCLLFGFNPQVVALYCIYFPMFGGLFGLIGKADGKAGAGLAICVNAILAGLSAAAFCAAALDLIKISITYKALTTALCWALGAIFAALLIAFDLVWLFGRGTPRAKRLLWLMFVTTAAAFCTVCFTLLDDVIEPLILGMTFDGAMTYFYASFAAMLPQTACTVVSVGLLFYPLTAILKKLY